MAKCRLCNTIIPDETEYCEDCRNKKAVSDEAYLDSLLNSVKSIDSKPKLNKKTALYPQASADMSTVPDMKDIQDTNAEAYTNTELDAYALSDNYDFADIQGETSTDTKSDINERSEIIDKSEDLNISEGNTSDSIFYINDLDSVEEIDDTNSITDDSDVDSAEDIYDTSSIADDNDIGYPDDAYDISSMSNEDDIDEAEFIGNLMDSANIDVDILDLFGMSDLGDLSSSNDNTTVDKQSNQASIEEDAKKPLSSSNNTNVDVYTENDISPKSDDGDNVTVSNDDDILALLGQVNQDDPVASDIQAISDMLSGNGPILNQDIPGTVDVGDVFADALKVVSSLEDYDPEAEIDLENITTDRAKKGKKKRKDKTKKDKSDEEQPQEKKPKKAKIKEKKNQSNELALDFDDIEGAALKAEEKGNKKKRNKEEKLDKKEKKEKKAAGKDKSSAQQVKSSPSKGELEDVTGDFKSPKKAKSDNKPDKANKKEKKKKKKEIFEVIDELEEEEGRINRVGVSVTLLLFGILVILLLIGTNMFSYSLSIKNAENYYNQHKYTDAYNEVYGLEFKVEDYEIYDKIQTVMFVNKQLNSYNNYYAMGKYPEALDSLLKGLVRYDKYIEYATLIGIQSDLEYVRDQIINELNNVFSLSEAEAVQLVKESKIDYSIKIYDIVLENMSLSSN